MNTKVVDNLVAHNMDTEFALFGVRTWEIWCWQGRAANQENLDEADFMETKFPSLRRKILKRPRIFGEENPSLCTFAIVPGSVATAYRSHHRR
jgi:hypothetical protein